MSGSTPKLSKTQLQALDYLHDRGGEAFDGCRPFTRSTSRNLYERKFIEPLSSSPLLLFQNWRITEDGEIARVNAHGGQGAKG